jgi:hypothetical protein
MYLADKVKTKDKVDGSFILEVIKDIEVHEAPPWGPKFGLKGKSVHARGPYQKENLTSVSKKELIFPILTPIKEDKNFYFVRVVRRRAWLGYIGESYLKIPEKTA